MPTPTSGWTTSPPGAAASTLPDPDAVQWQTCDFDALGVHRLQAIYAARQQVFVVEQQCVYLDVDGLDPRAQHLSAWLPDAPLPLAYARVLQPGAVYAEASIGRVLTTGAARGTGLGRRLVQRAIALADALHPLTGLRISAQHHLLRFYAGFGFNPVGAPYLEDGILHIEMCRPAVQAPSPTVPPRTVGR